MRDASRPDRGRSGAARLASTPAGERRALQLLGLARRAGRAAIGTQSVRGAARRGELAAVLIARDAGGNAEGRVRSLLEARGVPLVRCASRGALGAAVGRGPTAVVGITDAKMAWAALASLSGGAAAAPCGEGRGGQA